MTPFPPKNAGYPKDWSSTHDHMTSVFLFKKGTPQLFTFPDCKCYQLVYDKRVIEPHHFPNLSLRISSPMPNHYLARLVRSPPDQLKPEERNLLHTWKNAIYEDVIRTTQKTYDWLLMFKDKQNMPNLLRALRRRDLPTIAQAVQSSPRFYTLCENCGLFDVEPLLWDMVRPDRQEAQAGRL